MASARTLDRFEARTYDALAGATHIRNALLVTRYKGELFLLEWTGPYVLRRLVHAINRRWSNFSAEQAQKLTPQLADLYDKLNQSLKLAESRPGFVSKRIHRPFVESLVNARDRVGDVLESVYLAANDDFKRLIDECIIEVRKRRSTGRDWRSSLAALPD